MLGELSLGGRVLPVKGAEEKLKAVRKGMVFLPWQHDATVRSRASVRQSWAQSPSRGASVA